MQVQVSHHRKLLWAQAMVVRGEEKAYTICQVWITKVRGERTNVRIEISRRGQHWGRDPTPRAVEGEPVYCRDGTRCPVGTRVLLARV